MSASESKSSRPRDASDPDPSLPSTARVGDILVKAGAIDRDQLDYALAEQGQWGRRIGVTLVKLGMVTETDLIRALAQQLGLPVVSLVGKRIAPDVLALVPPRLAVEHTVLPLFLKPGDPMSKLFLGMEDPSDLAALDDLCFRTGLEIQPVMVGPTELAEAIDRFYLRAPKPESEPISESETLGELSLRRMGSPETKRAASEDGGSEPLGPLPKREPEDYTSSNTVHVTVDPLPKAERKSLSQTFDSKAAESAEAVADEIAALKVELDEARADAERTRVVLKALTQMFVERALIPFSELQSRIDAIKNADESRED